MARISSQKGGAGPAETASPRRPADEAPGPLERVLPLVLAGVVIAVWLPVLGLPFTGEDYVLLSRIRVGEVASPQVFRPLSDAWLRALHAVFGAESSLPYHAGSLVLHVGATLLLYRVARELLGGRRSAALVAALFGVGAGCVDSLAWIAAVNRLLSGLAALVAILGVLWVRARPRTGAGLAVAGITLQLLANEEVYGTAMLVVGALALSAWRSAPSRALALGGIAFCFVALAWRHYGPEQTPGDVAIPALRAARITASVAARARLIAEGLGIPGLRGLGGVGGLVLPVAGVLVLALVRVPAGRPTRAAAWGAAWWLASLVPFALVEPSRYRFYPTLAPTALLAGGAAWVLVSRATRGRYADLALLALLVAGVLASHGARSERLGRWRAALVELEACARDAREIRAGREDPPVLMNLELSSTGPFFYYFGLTRPEELTALGFLDAVSCFEDPGRRPPGPWYGRRVDGSLGLVDPELYLARPVVAPFLLYDRAVRVTSLEDARRQLASPDVDLRETALLEADEAVVARFDGRGGDGGDGRATPGEIEVLEPFAHEGTSARMTIRVRAERTVLFAYHEHWVFDFLWRTSPDQAVIIDASEVRRIRMTARDRDTGESFAIHPVNALGLGAILPAGDRVVELAWSLRRPRLE